MFCRESHCNWKFTGGVTVEGDILINGRPVGDYMRHISGFMHQEDIFIGSLTVWEHMTIMVKKQNYYFHSLTVSIIGKNEIRP